MFDRESRLLRPDELPASAGGAIAKALERHGLDDDPVGRGVAAIETASTAIKSGLGRLFGKPKTTLSWAIVTPTWLWIALDPGDDPHAFPMRLAGMEVLDHAQTVAARLATDHGLSLTSFRPGEPTRTNYFLGMGEGAAADTFAAALRAAVAAAGPG